MKAELNEMKVDYLKAATEAALWLSNPVSEEGTAHFFKLMYAMSGPRYLRNLDWMKKHPDGRRLLKDRPDLGATLVDIKKLARMPDGSLGRAYADYMDKPDIVPAYLLSGLMYRFGALDSLPWGEETKWLIDRLGNTHDLLHLLTGYGTDLAGEVILIAFSVAQTEESFAWDLFGRWWGTASAAVLRPSVGASRWRTVIQESYERGIAFRRHQPLSCVYFEELLPLPLEEVRKKLGILPLSDPEMQPGTWFTSKIYQQMGVGYGEKSRQRERIAMARKVVEEYGVPAKKLMSAPKDVQERAATLVRSGAPKEAVVSLLQL